METAEGENLNLVFSNYKKSLIKKCSDPSKVADIKRKCIAQRLHQSFASLDNASVCNLLEENLRDYTNTVNHGSNNIYDIQLKNKLKELNVKPPVDLTSSINELKLSDLIKPLECAKNQNSFVCRHSVNSSKVDFEKFLDVIKKKANPSHLPEQRQRKIAKSFVPSCCVSVSKNTLKMPLSKSSENFDKYEKRELSPVQNYFKTARDELNIQNMKKNSQNSIQTAPARKVGLRRGVGGKFVSPLISAETNETESCDSSNEQFTDERLKNIEPKMVELIRSEIMDNVSNVDWSDIAGLDFAKTSIQEAVVWPLLRPDIFTGLRRPPKGILLFGPPGTGKTLIGKCVASQSKSTFFSISASSLTSKWIGEGEKMVRALFAVARVHQPSVIFIDEIDSLLTQRSDTEHESSRRIKTEFLVQLDGATTDSEERLLLIGATNRPQELDEAARRRFVKRLYIPLPNYEARLQLVQKLLAQERHNLTLNNINEIATLTDGYSGADIKSLCSEASLGPIRSLDLNLIEKIQASDVRPLNMEDFHKALNRVRSSVSSADINQHVEWDHTFGSGGI